MDSLFSHTKSIVKKSDRLVEICAALLVLLFVYTAASKLLSFNDFEIQMNNQALPHWLNSLLIWTLPGSEIFVAALLLFGKTRSLGFILSSFLMALFTGYVGLVLANYYERTPCSCGGVLRSMGWKLHFIFNLFFLLLSLLGIYLKNRERRTIGKD